MRFLLRLVISFVVLCCSITHAEPLSSSEQQTLANRADEADENIEKLLLDRFNKCVAESPLNSRRAQCAKERGPIRDQATQSSNNCIQYYARGTREQWECRASSYERAYKSLQQGSKFEPFEAPDGSTKSKKNTFTKI